MMLQAGLEPTRQEGSGVVIKEVPVVKEVIKEVVKEVVKVRAAALPSRGRVCPCRQT